MKRTTSFTSFLGLALSAALGCDPGPNVPPPVGGQSGDDGGERDPDPLPIPPRAPEPPCDAEESELGAADATVFGVSVQELLDNLELGGPTPLFWVPFDSIAATTFAPGPGETTLRLGIALREGQSAAQVVHTPDPRAAACPSDTVSMPVHVSLATADGALAEGFDALLDFTTGKVARLVARLSPDELTGSFAFATIGAPAQGFAADMLAIYVDLWPGGSRGSIQPQFRQTGIPTPPPPAAPSSDHRGAPPVRGGSTADVLMPTPIVPDHWSAVAVWPRREVCPDDGRAGVVMDLQDPVSGISPLDVIGALGGKGTWPLVSATGETAVQVTFEAPSGLVCVRPRAGTLELDVRATLRANGGASGSPLDHLDATTILSVGGRAAADGNGLVGLHWSRRDVVSGQARDAFEAATGLVLAAPDEYRDIWWSWHGVETRTATTVAWSARASLAVSSLNAQQAADLASVVARGGPGASIRVDAGGFPVLPGDTLLDAELSP